ncbi:XkdF-like putative serine protease domain-containing protein [Galbibacter pacificus]|uniref:XkdF-like putative serine protease domain-containing protein n=1 Tax=Galbibacter pacificus TaxID=2996052 RepID=A0ABT6FQD2_9FLAO|nr:XkdF-like putative serine protease domain-containing protein [Galbibacter pacificus]MDG3582049.1 XkdF-like putative serine protease domain-containing protein [Galbibacter pacificus]MDG3585477.1 XkdF-like putative serine protease domain-containing protein [Galbibacter pacificus]
MEVYNVIFNEKEDKGIYALSLVENPAMEGMFVALKENEKPETFHTQLSTIDEEQRLLVGLAMQPDKLIYRNVEGREFYITFSKEEIKKGAHAFLKNHFNNNSSLEHEEVIDGVAVVESWIIEDAEHDKSKKYGFEYPVGSWMVAMKVDSDEVWNSYVKSGKVKGFSIDGLFSLEKINLKSDMNVIDELKKGFAELKAMLSNQEIKLGSIKAGDITIYFEGELLALDAPVFSDEEMKETLQDNEYELETGMIAVVTDGKVAELKEPQPEEEVELANEDLLKELNSLKSEFEAYKASLSKQLEDKEKEVADLKAELSETPATKPIKHTPVQLASKEVTGTNPKERIFNRLRNS